MDWRKVLVEFYGRLQLDVEPGEDLIATIKRENPDRLRVRRSAASRWHQVGRHGRYPGRARGTKAYCATPRRWSRTTTSTAPTEIVTGADHRRICDLCKLSDDDQARPSSARFLSCTKSRTPRCKNTMRSRARREVPREGLRRLPTPIAREAIAARGKRSRLLRTGRRRRALRELGIARFRRLVRRARPSSWSRPDNKRGVMAGAASPRLAVGGEEGEDNALRNRSGVALS